VHFVDLKLEFFFSELTAADLLATKPADAKARAGSKRQGGPFPSVVLIYADFSRVVVVACSRNTRWMVVRETR
jgi:hypothetical protein